MNGLQGELAVVGDLLEDVVVWGTDRLEHATDNPATIVRSRGGSGANVAVAAASLVPVRFIGRIGDDALGAHLESELTENGIDARVQRDGTTGTVIVLVDPDGERTMIPDRAAAAELGRIEPSWLDGVAWLHIPMYGFATSGAAAAIREFAAVATARGIPISLDTSSVSLLRGLGVDRALALISELAPAVVFANAAEAAFLGLPRSAAGSESTFILKNGGEPVTVVAGGDRFSVEVEAVPMVRDSTGAGDAFAAGYLASAMRGLPPLDCVKDGSRTAAGVLLNPGAHPGTRPLQIVS